VILTTGTLIQRTGVQIADGYWHFIAVTWSSYDGATFLYVDGMLMFSTIMAKGMAVGDGGSLILGQDQRIDHGWCCSTLPNRYLYVDLHAMQGTRKRIRGTGRICYASAHLHLFVLSLHLHTPEHLRGNWPTLRSGTSR